jgi:uncharacterized DUF497 family protein
MSNKLIYSFDGQKNAWLTKTRGVSFEEVIAILQNQGAVEVIQHPNTKKYPRQKMYVIELNEYIYLVPFVEENETIFLKTIFPNRKATKKYLQKEV